MDEADRREQFAAYCSQRWGIGPETADRIYPSLVQMAEWVIEVVERFTPVAERVLAIQRRIYEEQGSPLGEGDEAMWAWSERQRALEDALPEKYLLTDEEEDAWDEIVEGLADF